MEKLQLFRGISLAKNEVDEIVDHIKLEGLYVDEKSHWPGFAWKNLKTSLPILLQKEDLLTSDTRPSSECIEAKNGGSRKYTEGAVSICFADRAGAEYYALKHNKTEDKKVPLLITAELELDSLAIDGRDFLYTVFGNIDPTDRSKTRRQLEKLKKLFGEKIEVYVDKIRVHPNSERVAICDLAIVDNDIIKEHFKNESLIGGRHNTLFKSAFFAKIPITPDQIKNIEILNGNYNVRTPDITLNSILER